METLASLAAGQGGKLLGTERLSAIPLAQASEGASGQAFASEVERAVERSRGDGSAERRREELEGARRAARRAGFGRERHEEARAVEGVFRAEQAPVTAQPAAAPRVARDASLAVQASPGSLAPVAAGANAQVRAAATVEPVTGTVSASANRQGGPQPVAPLAPPRTALEAPVAAGTPANEGQPVELSQVERAGGKAVKTASATRAPAGPDAAVLEHAAEILRQIQLHATPFVRRLTLELEPAELGRLSIQLALRAGKVAAIVRGESEETLELLRAREAELLKVLAGRGIEADSVRFELGFGRERPRRGMRGSSDPAAPAAPASSFLSQPSIPPRARSARIDLHA